MRSKEKVYGINVVSQLTGVSGHVIRAWERRYGVVEPGRTSTNRRRYSDEDVARFRLLSAATSQGHAIGNIANLSLDELAELQLPRPQNLKKSDDPDSTKANGDVSSLTLEQCKEAVLALDPAKLESSLLSSERKLGLPKLLESVVCPLLTWIGDSWNRGALQIAHEHLVTEIVSHFLSGLQARRGQSISAPRIVVATPPGQYHEIGALIAAALASMQGWNVLYLGKNLPPSDIAFAAGVSGASCVALSIIYPADDPFLARDLFLLRECLPSETVIIAGGSACYGYEAVLREVGASVHYDIQGFQDTLIALRSRRNVTDTPMALPKQGESQFHQPPEKG